jgi:hypothetical protein
MHAIASEPSGVAVRAGSLSRQIPTLAVARRLARKSPKTGKNRSLRAISAELAALGHLGPAGKPYFPGSVARMLSAH